MSASGAHMDSDEASHLNASLASLTLGKRTRHDSAPNCYIDGATSASTSFNKKKARDSNDCHMFEEYREPSVRENGGAKLGRTSSQMDFDEYMQVNHGSCSDDKKNWALTIYNDNQDTIRNRLERVGSINDKNDKGQGLRLLASLWKNEPQKLPVEDKAATMLRETYIVPEHNNMQIIIHPDAAYQAGRCDALLKVLKPGFLDEAANFRKNEKGVNGKLSHDEQPSDIKMDEG